MQAARVSADAVAAAVTLTNDCIKDGNAVEATSKAAASAWRSSQVSNDKNDKHLLFPEHLHRQEGASDTLASSQPELSHQPGQLRTSHGQEMSG